MYLIRGADGFDENSLRQGDILAGVPFPLLEHTKTHVLGGIAQEYDYTALPNISPKTHEHRTDREWVTIQIPARFCLCAVLSNCCDLEPRNGKVSAQIISLARLRPISPDIRRDAERFGSLCSNKDPRDQEDAGYIGYFYLEPHALLQNQDWIVQFEQIVGIPSTDNALLLRKKILQLDDRTRVKFKIKLGITFLRINNEEIAAGLENPWEEIAAAQPPAQEAAAEQALQPAEAAPAPATPAHGEPQQAQ